MLSLVLVARRPRACVLVCRVSDDRERGRAPPGASVCVCAVSQAVSLTRVGLVRRPYFTLGETVCIL